jgi:Ca2+-binding EF-hand superfamily protein
LRISPFIPTADHHQNANTTEQEFVFNLSILSRGTLDEKLEWTFQLYDVNGDGFISKDEMTEVMTSVYELMGKVSEGCKEENQIKAKVENMFKVSRELFRFCVYLLWSGFWLNFFQSFQQLFFLAVA